MIFLGIGSNLQSSFGNRFKNINLAISLIEKNNIKLIKKSSYYESTSFPNVKDPKFINIVIFFLYLLILLVSLTKSDTAPGYSGEKFSL